MIEILTYKNPVEIQKCTCGSIHICTTHWKTWFYTTKFLIECKECDRYVSGRSKNRTIKKWNNGVRD